ncbi:MAG TPA: tetratricopeptide repeat protein [Vicinamibacterales bacterium]|jgi:tetratricopeptide (TPR) repeat protein|nr:tetratricopeptide repeat protein [Vicinamibacterales bacterium]
MPFRFRFGLAVCAAGMLLTLPVHAQGRRGGAADAPAAQVNAQWKGKSTLAGKVVDEAGKGVADAKVTLVLAEINSGFFVQTKKNGEFEAKDIKAGEWRLQTEAPNFVVVRQTVKVADGKNPALSIVVKRDYSPELLAKADTAFNAGQLDEARTEYLKVLEAHPELTAINRAIAFTYGKEKNNVEALKYLDLALAGNPDDAVLLQLAAATSIELNDPTRAMTYVSRIDDSTISDPDLLVNTAISMLNRRRSAEATTVLDRVIARFPQAADPYFYRGYAKLQASKGADAKPDLEKYLEMSPAGAQADQAKQMIASIK